MTNSPLAWSAELDATFREIVLEPIRKDGRTDYGKNLHLGLDFQVIRQYVLGMGLADFSVGYSDGPVSLTADEVVLLYCYVSMRKHFFTSLALFRKWEAVLKQFFEPGRRSVMIDLGCGPGTAALALAECLGDTGPTCYVGIDSASPMLKMADQFWTAAELSDAPATWIPDWEALALPGEKPLHILLNSSYFFASPSLAASGLPALIAFVRQLRAAPHVESLAMTYTNSLDARAEESYRTLLEALCPGLIVEIETMSIQYLNRLGTFDAKTETFGAHAIGLKAP